MFELLREPVPDTLKPTSMKFGFSRRAQDKSHSQSQNAHGPGFTSSKKSGMGSISKAGISNKKTCNLNSNTMNSASSNYHNQSGGNSKGGNTNKNVYSSLSVNSLPHFNPSRKQGGKYSNNMLNGF